MWWLVCFVVLKLIHNKTTWMCGLSLCSSAGCDHQSLGCSDTINQIWWSRFAAFLKVKLYKFRFFFIFNVGGFEVQFSGAEERRHSQTGELNVQYTIQAHSDTHLGVVVVLQTDLSVSIYTIPTLCFNLREETMNHKLLFTTVPETRRWRLLSFIMIIIVTWPSCRYSVVKTGSHSVFSAATAHLLNSSFTLLPN